MLNGLRKAIPPASVPSVPRHLELLAHYEVGDPETGDRRSGFAVILELTDRRLLIEGDVAFTPGDDLSIRFFLPAPEADSGRVNISLQCTIAQCRDATKLHYSARVSKIGQASKKAILGYGPDASGDSR